MDLAVVLVALSLVIPAVVLAKPPKPALTTVQILNVSDWHGNVDPLANIGGAWNISARWAEDRQSYPTLTLTAGDDFGATPALSSFFAEVPAVLAQRLMGIQVGTFGNHDFDAGVEHLQDMIDLAGAPTSVGAPGTPYRYVAANLANINDELTDVAPYAIFDVGGIKVAVIGIVNEEAPNLVLPGNFGTMVPTDGVAAANKYAKAARKAGADLVTVITHKGLDVASPAAGPLLTFAAGLTDQIDVVFGDHTDIQFSGTVNGILVHENRSYGGSYARTLVTVKVTPGKGRPIQSKSVSFVSPAAAVLTASGANGTGIVDTCPAVGYCDQAIVDMLVPYRQQLAALLDGQVATSTAPFDNDGTPRIQRSGETPLGDLIADGMQWRYNTDLAFMNGGGIRKQFPDCGYLPTNNSLNRSNWNGTHTGTVTCGGYASGATQDIVLGDVFSVLPFGNIVTTKTVTGHTLWIAMENGVSRIAADGTGADGRFPQISGFKFTYDYSKGTGCTGNATTGAWTACSVSRVTGVWLTDDTPIPDDATEYTLALPNFHNLGGDSYFMFNDHTGVTQDLDALVMTAYIEFLGGTLDPASYLPLSRIVGCNGACP